jgi:hypothetical protein
MRIRLIDYDAIKKVKGRRKNHIPNLALMKLSAFHKAQGDVVGFDVEDPDEVKVSAVFPVDKAELMGMLSMFPGAKVTIGGTGWDISIKLPPEVEDGVQLKLEQVEQPSNTL